jgi:hypothetical protein
VTVSTAAALFSNRAWNWMTTYSASGAPGRLRVKVADLSLRDLRAPSGERTDLRVFSQSAFVIAALKT